MALSASSSCMKTVTALSEPVKVSKSPSQGKANHQAGGVLPVPVKPKFQSSALQRTKSRKPVKGTKVSASVQEATVTPESVISQAVTKVGGDIATASGDILDAVDTVIEDGAGPAGAMRVRKSTGKANSRTSRRRALVMCLALGMVRPCASGVESNMQSSSNADLRRTASAMPALRRTASTSFKAPSTLVSQVSLATTMKQTNLLGEQEDLQKLTSLQ